MIVDILGSWHFSLTHSFDAQIYACCFVTIANHGEQIVFEKPGSAHSSENGCKAKHNYYNQQKKIGMWYMQMTFPGFK